MFLIQWGYSTGALCRRAIQKFRIKETVIGVIKTDRATKRSEWRGRIERRTVDGSLIQWN